VLIFTTESNVFATSDNDLTHPSKMSKTLISRFTFFSGT